MGSVIAFMNEKGGTGKTTLTVHFAYYISLEGEKVLLVDLDPQGQAGKVLRIFPEQTTLTTTDLLKERIQGDPLPTSYGNLFLIPSRKDLAEPHPPFAYENLRKNLLSLAKRYDLLLLDTPPSPSPLTQTAITSADGIFVPVALTYLSFDGSAELIQTLNQKAGKEKVKALIPTLYRKTLLAEEILSRLRKYFPGKVTTPLPISVKLDEAQSHGKTLWEYAPSSPLIPFLNRIMGELKKRLP